MFNVRPPGVKADWEDIDVITQASMLGFYQVAEHDRIVESTRVKM